ncbi:MAG: DNA ligase D, partial [Burkholderiales bacterium]|nr:DNA ligase D [Burkholderiales bacterium]
MSERRRGAEDGGRSTRPAARAQEPLIPLTRYNEKRNFTVTSEPAGVPRKKPHARSKGLSYVIQKHWASRLHYDFRLELDGVLLSWAVPKGPSFDPAVKQMAIHVEDHPVSYGAFEGTIPKGQYGAGTVIVWDTGTWEPVGDPREGMDKGKLIFKLHGQKLAGLWELVRISKPGEVKQEQWLLLKKRGDTWARPLAEYDVITALPDSVVQTPLGLIEDREPRISVGTPLPIAQAHTTTDMKHAIKAPLPKALAPQLATLASVVPANVQWITETKFDGYRMLARIEHDEVRLITRNGNDWTSKLTTLASAVKELGLVSAWLDGEMVVLNKAGVPDFNMLQNAIDNARTKDIVYFVFDVPFLGGMDLRKVPLASRRAVLAELFDRRGSDRIRFSQAFDAPPTQMLEAACRMGLEGVMAKRADAPYVSARTETWLKLKCQMRQEFVVIGFSDRSGVKDEVGGLLLGYHEAGVLRYGGSVGTGWNAAQGRDLHAALARLEVDRPAVDPKTVKPGRWSKGGSSPKRWVKPHMVVEVAFGEWTPDGHVRHPTFRGVREEKPPGAITRELPKRWGEGTALASTHALPSSVKVTNPERVIDPSTGFRKLDLVRYYESIADWMLPHLKDRPVSLVRAPEGITGQTFFQKHPESKMPGLQVLDPMLWPGHPALLAVQSREALVAAAQMNVVEFHTWNSTTRRIDQPDRVIFDLDPGEGVPWTQMLEAATLMNALLEELGLRSWLKTSGGKGLHVVVPLAPKLSYDEVKRFSQAAVVHMARTIPSRFVAKSGGTHRVGKIFIDYLRNGHAQTTAAAFSARARPGMGVSMPVAWEQLMTLKSGSQWTIAT